MAREDAGGGTGKGTYGDVVPGFCGHGKGAVCGILGGTRPVDTVRRVECATVRGSDGRCTVWGSVKVRNGRMRRPYDAACWTLVSVVQGLGGGGRARIGVHHQVPGNGWKEFLVPGDESSHRPWNHSIYMVSITGFMERNVGRRGIQLYGVDTEV